MVARYYHGRERGTLPATGVSDRVLDALATIVGVSAERLREAGREGAGAAPGPAATVAFARVGEPDPQYADEGRPAGAGAGEQEAHDEIDDLFTGPSAS